MIDSVDVVTASTSPQFRRRMWVLLALVVVLLAGGVVSAVAVSFHYTHAPALIVNGGRWLPPDQGKSESVNNDQSEAIVAAARLGQSQTFEVDLYNPSSVSQRVLGLTNAKTLGDPKFTGEPEHISISTSSIRGQETLTYTTKSVVIPPHGTYSLRVTQDTGQSVWGTTPCNRSEFWDSVSLRVRVGAFTRTETVKFDGMIIELLGPGNNCKAIDTGQ